MYVAQRFRSPSQLRKRLAIAFAGSALLLCERSGHSLRMHSVSWADGMIATTKGRYHLRGQVYNTKARRGSYTFDRGTGQVIDDKDGVVGVFSAHPIDMSPIDILRPGDAKMPIMHICNSEIMTEIQKSENEGAYFVLPSQLNGAEYPSNDEIIQSIDDYRFDQTGGPRGQLAVHPAAGQFILDNAANERRPLGINAVQELLQELDAANLRFRLENGYLVVPKLPESQHEIAIAIMHQHLHTLRVLMMEEIPACGLTPSKEDWSPAEHRVNLVYASAVPIQAYMNYGDATHARLQEAVGSLVLLAQYLGALKTAARNAKSAGKGKRIFLMPLGGGVFNNPWAMIFVSMAKAVELLSEEERACLDIQVLTWQGNPSEKQHATRCLSKLGKLKPPAARL